MTSTVSLEPGKYYHVYNRGNNRENLFREGRNYAYFLELYAYHVAPVADTYAYCLLHNHFHLLVRIKESTDPSGPVDLTGLGKGVSRGFSNFFNAYTKAFNRAYQRTGALFQRPFQRIEVSSEPYLFRLVIYIHQNPQRHGFVADFHEWPYSSYHTLLSGQPTRLCRRDVLDWFGGRDNVRGMHESVISEGLVNTLAPGDSTWTPQR